MTPNTDVRFVHLVFKTHLDLGFTDLAQNVTTRYRESYIPRAIRLAEESRQYGRIERFVWTIGTWMLWDYLEHTDAEGRASMDRAIAAGDIEWMAVPFTTQTEFLDPSLFEFGLTLSQRLDARYGRKTIAAKMTDVPGHTRSIIPSMARAGVRFLHLGINPSSPPPEVPSLFRWKHPNGDELAVMIQKDYGQVAVLPDGVTAVAVSHTGDNYGPPEMMVVDEAYWALRKEFPNATIEATSLNAIGNCVCGLSDRLPVVTSEIGDTWIHGMGTDPTKTRRFRELSRLRRRWITNGAIAVGSELETALSLPLLAIGEHTWGLDEKASLGNYTAYEPDAFEEMRQQERCKRFESSWAEQRNYIDQALEALSETPLERVARERLLASEPVLPSLDGYQPVDDPLAVIESDRFSFAFANDGSIGHLFDRSTGRQWADPDHRLFGLRHQTFSWADNERFYRQYSTIHPFWAITSFTKLGMDKADQSSGFTDFVLTSLYRHENGKRYIAELRAPKTAPNGCPERAFVLISIHDEETAIDVDVRWFDKRANRKPEAVWLAFEPVGIEANGWLLDKMGQPVDPLDVARNGNRKLHSVNRFVRYSDPRGGLLVETIDAPLVAPGEPSLLDFNNRQPPIERGVHFNLYNNVWCTNFPMWFSDDARFRFRLSFGDCAERTWTELIGLDNGKD